MSRILYILFLPLILIYIAYCFFQQRVLVAQSLAPREASAGTAASVVDDGADGLYEYF